MRAASATALALACAGACLAPSYDIVESLGDAGESGTGGDSGGSGGSIGSGGSSSGGKMGNGGSVSPPTGGAPTGGDGGEDPGSGGANTGGASGNGKGGSSTGGKGGATPTGGGPTGGSPPTGGAAGGPPTGGMGGVAGAPPMGGAGGTVIVAGSGGGPTVGCDMAFTVSPEGFVRAPGASCWFGYAYAGGDVGSTVAPTSFAACGPNCVLRSYGTVGPATAANSYRGVVFLGFNINQAAGTTNNLTRIPTGTALVISFAKTSGPSPIRVQLNGAGADRWCATLTTSPATIPYTMFNTACWDNTGAAYAKQPINAIQLVVPGAETAQAIDITLVSVSDQ